jgi:hypothetical protein
MLFLSIEPSDMIMYLGLVIISIIIGGLIIRWAVRSDSIVKNQEAIIWFMILQCKKQGVSDEEIQNLKDHFRIK